MSSTRDTAATNGPNTEAGVRHDAREWLIRRDVDAITDHLWPWLLAYDATTTDTHPGGGTAAAVISPPPPLLGTPEWVAADDTTRNASIAAYVLACLAEREPTVIAARLAAEIANARALRLVAARQASHAISAAHDWTTYARNRVPYAELQRRRGEPYPRPPVRDPRTHHYLAGAADRSSDRSGPDPREETRFA